jgi:PAS domain S-box-containing protein
MESDKLQDLLKRIDLLSEKEKRWEVLNAELLIQQKEAEKKIESLNGRLIEEYENRKRTKAEIQYYRRILDYIPHIIIEVNIEGYPEFVSKLFFEVTGLNKEDFPKNWTSVFHPDRVDDIRETWRKKIAEGTNFKLEHQMVTTEGNYKWFLSQVTPIRESSGTIIKWIATATEIDSERRFREKLHESEEQFRFMAESIPQIVWTSLPDGYEDFHNKKFEDYTGIKVEEAKGWGWKKVIHPDDLEHTIAMWQNSLKTGSSHEIEYRYRRFDGEYRWFLSRALPKKDANGKIVKWFGTTTDIHEEKLISMKLQKAIKELRDSHNELARVNDILNNFVYIAAHDLRSPVTNLKMIFDLLKEEKEDEKKATYINLLEKSVDRLGKTIHGLVEVIDLESIQQQIKRISFLQAMEGVIGDLSQVHPNLHSHIQMDFMSSPEINYIEPYLISIIRNIISNAYKYQSQDRLLEIKVATSTEGEFVKLTIQDNGKGFDSDNHKEIIFKPFKRLTHEGDGKGVGLFLVKNLVEKNGGKIDVVSKIDVGTTFILYLREY